MMAVNLPTVVLSTVVSVVVSVIVTGSLRFTGFHIRERWSTWRARRRILSEGDHETIDAGSLVPLGPGENSSRVGVRVAPAVRFNDSGTLDPDDVERWLAGFAPSLATHRDYCDPSDVVRYSTESLYAEVRVNGFIEVCVPVADEIDDASDAHRLLLSSVVAGVVPIVVSVCDGAFEALFPSRLRTSRVDWRFDVSRVLGLTSTYGPRHRDGLIFPGREPAFSTVGQSTPDAGREGFGGRHVRNLPINTDPVEIVVRFLTGLIERSGYTGNADALEDLRAIVEQEVWRAR